MQRPDAQHVVDLPLVGRDLEHLTKITPATPPATKRADRMHHVGARAHGDEARERAVVHEARVVIADDHGRKDAAAHRHQRVDRDEAGDPLQRSARSSR